MLQIKDNLVSWFSTATLTLVCMGGFAGALSSDVSYAQGLPPADVDVVTYENYPCDHAQLALLQRDGELVLPDPRGGWLNIRLAADPVASETMVVLNILVNDLPGIITLTPTQFFATLPTRRGTLRLENSGGETRLVDEQWLSFRQLPNARDFREIPNRVGP